MLCVIAAVANAATIRVSPDEIVLGDPVDIVFEGLPDNAPLSLRLDLTDGFGAVWKSETVLTANELVRVEGTDATKLRDPHRLFWSAERVSTPDHLADDQAPNAAVVGAVTLRSGDTVLARTEFKQWIQRNGVSRSDAVDGVIGSLYSPLHASGAGVLVLGGSGGGMTWSQQIAAVLASKGHHALGIAYFNARNLPAQADRIPLEYFLRAIAQLRRAPGVDPKKIVIVSQSWGTQAALLLGTIDRELAGIIALVPGSAAFQAVAPPNWPMHSSWTWRGKDVPFTSALLADGFSEPEDPIERWMIVLANRQQFARGQIHIEEIEAPVLLFSARGDRIWPSTYMSEQLVQRALANKRNARIDHEAYANAGHAITQPPFTPTTTVVARNGGTPEGTAAARQASWEKILRFLEQVATK